MPYRIAGLAAGPLRVAELGLRTAEVPPGHFGPDRRERSGIRPAWRLLGGIISVAIAAAPGSGARSATVDCAGAAVAGLAGPAQPWLARRAAFKAC